jgi:selenium-dependent xanthine dehydrogenase
MDDFNPACRQDGDMFVGLREIFQESIMKFRLNGVEKTFLGDPDLALLKYLREQEYLISPKDGCSPQAACGACTVEIDGKAVLSCVTPMSKVEGCNIFTTEGLEELIKNALVFAFAEKGAVQCGFCTPGIVMRAKVLLQNNPNPTREEIITALKYHLCRCTGYLKIVEAILSTSKALHQSNVKKIHSSDARVGSRHKRYDVERLILGKRPFVADLRFENMGYGAFKFSDHPRAQVTSISTKRAKKMSGVIRIFTAKDVPGKRQIGLITEDWPIMIKEGETTNYIGDIIAGIVAVNEDTARKAVELIDIEYVVKEPITDVHKAIKEDSEKIHNSKSNILEKCFVQRGDAELKLQSSAYVVERTFQTQVIEHGFLEPEACVAKPWKDGIEVFSQSQGIYEDRRQISAILDLPENQINVRLVPNGGGFGGKEDMSIQGQTALFAYLLKMPVKIILNREESIRLHPKRHPMKLQYKLGCDDRGKLTALKAKIIGDTGAYASVGAKVLERTAGHSTGAYHVPVVDVEAYAVYTNNIPCGAMRGFGVNQANFAMEGCVDELCVQGGFDCWQFRYDNALKKGSITASGQELEEGVGVRETLQAVKKHYEDAPYAGIACGIKNTGIGNGMNDESTVKIEVVSNNLVRIHHGWTEMGQGVNTVAVQIVCQETGIDPEIIEVIAETKSEAPAGMTTASRATSLLGNAIIDASLKMRDDLKNNSLSDLSGKNYNGHWVCDWTTKPGQKEHKEITHYSYGYATQLVTLDQNGKIDCIYAAHDAGKIINPTMFEGQIEGSVHMGLGYAVSEELILENGAPISFRLQACGILRAKDMPKVKVIGVEVKDRVGPYGAKGIGEIGLVPTAPAVANAFYQYDKKRRYSLPIKDYRWRKKHE